MQADLRRIEVDRIENLVRGFGWEKVSETLEGLEIRITFTKTLPEELAKEVAGPGPEVTGPT